MWVPNDADEIERAARAGDLTETSSFDAKEHLPQAARNIDLAVDVAAMSTDGGALLYGIGEDEAGRLTIPAPIALEGAAERVDQIVSTSIAEVPYIDVRSYPFADDPSRGYLLVIVPQSARAPHQVTVRGNLRFYGRGATGNRILTEGEVARLYQRRQSWEVNADQLLAEAVGAARFEPQGHLGYLHAFARPVAPDRAIWDRAVASAGARDALLRAMQEAAASPGPSERFSPTLKGQAYWHRDGADAWRLSSQYEPSPEQQRARSVVDVAVNVDGRGHLFCGRAAERRSPNVGPDPEGQLAIFEVIIAGNFAAFLGVMGALYRAAGYHGHVDLGLAVTGIQGGYSLARVAGQQIVFLDHLPAFTAASYPRTERVASAELDQPEEVARRMLRHLFDATTEQEGFDPFV